MLKWIAILLLAAAAIIGSISWVKVNNSREAAALARQRTAESAAEQAKDEARKAQSEEKMAASRDSAMQQEAKIRQEERMKKEAEKESKALEAEKAKHDAAAAKDMKAAKESEAKAAQATREAEKAREATAKAQAEAAKAEAERARLEAEAVAKKAETEQARAEAAKAEAKLWELKALDLVALERELNEYKQELDERELALRPEKTIKDLVNIAPEEEGEKTEDGKILPENDRTIPAPERALHKANRLKDEKSEELFRKSRALTVARLEKLYLAAIKEDRITDAYYYESTIKSFYPDWKLGEADKEKTKEQEETK